MLDFIVMQMSKVKREKGYCFQRDNLSEAEECTGEYLQALWVVVVQYCLNEVHGDYI